MWGWRMFVLINWLIDWALNPSEMCCGTAGGFSLSSVSRAGARSRTDTSGTEWIKLMCEQKTNISAREAWRGVQGLQSQCVCVRPAHTVPHSATKPWIHAVITKQEQTASLSGRQQGHNYNSNRWLLWMNGWICGLQTLRQQRSELGVKSPPWCHQPATKQTKSHSWGIRPDWVRLFIHVCDFSVIKTAAQWLSVWSTSNFNKQHCYWRHLWFQNYWWCRNLKPAV